MDNRLITGETLSLGYPDGFHIMTGEELSKMNVYGGGTGEGLSDPDRHILITVGYKHAGALTGLLANAKDAAGSMEGRLKKLMQPYGYKKGGFCTKTVGNESAEGFSYEYEAQGIGMYGESYVIKRGKTFWYLHFYARTELKAESLKVWYDILSSAEWIQ